MPRYGDRVEDTSSTTGTGDLTLDAAPPTGCVSFSSVFEVGSIVSYVVELASDGSIWEVGECPLSASTTLQRSAGRVLASSNSGALANFTGATKVWSNMSAYLANRSVSRGKDVVMMHSLP